MLTVSGLSAGYGDIPVLHHISMAIASSESVGILGHNGMGKTTFLRCLIGALKPSAGSVQLEGQDVTRLAPHSRARLGMAYVPQGREIFPTLSVRDNLRMGLVKTGESAPAALDALLVDFPAVRSRAASSSCCPSPGRSRASRSCCCWTNPPKASSPRSSKRSRRRSLHCATGWA
jgi:ABC-type branched-subunit amino acid transport system ATPase component